MHCHFDWNSLMLACVRVHSVREEAIGRKPSKQSKAGSLSLPTLSRAESLPWFNQCAKATKTKKADFSALFETTNEDNERAIGGKR